MRPKKLPVYFDFQATTPLDKRVFDVMYPYFMEEFGNCHSSSHAFGWKAMEAVQKARTQVANLINAKTDEIIFTSGATESNNLAIKGFARANKTNEKNHIISVKTEHKCVLESVKSLKREGFDITLLNVQHDGLISLEELEKAITNKTILVSIMGVNNEIGVIQPLKEIGQLCKKHGIIFHTDCAQAFGKIPLNVEDMNIDLMSISGHKIYGPKGVGALYIRNGIKIEPLFSGGGQEKKLRSGTLPVPLVVGLGAAAKFAKRNMEKNAKHAKELFNMLYKSLSKTEGVYLNGSKEHRWYGNANYSFAGIEGESLMIRCKEIAVSSGSACTSENLKPSYVIEALGGDPELAHSSIRIGFGKDTTKDEVQYFIDRVKQEVKYLRDMSPLWDQMKEKSQSESSIILKKDNC
ncbi:MAG: IscS subfamily cysteine desulfurase [Rickettsiales bacterium]|nr:IscS subfamily cysteine desulfurase [Rickettsiales bacterium]